MTALSYAEQLIPEELKEPVAEFVSSGLAQVERVFKGPRPRHQGSSALGYRNKSRPTCIGSRNCDATLARQSGRGTAIAAAQPPNQPTKILLQRMACPDLMPEPSRNTKRRPSAAFVLAALPAGVSPLLLSADRESSQLPLRVISDTVRHIFAGTAARTMSQAFIHPIDTVKTRLQVNKLTAPLQLQNWRSRSKAQTINVFVGRRKVLQLRNWLVQGPVDLYRGLTGAILGTIPVAMVYFCTYEACKSALERRKASGAVTHLTSASVGAVVSAFLRVPTDTLKHQTQAYIVPNIFQGARSILASQGIAGLYHGLLPTLLRDVPELALQFSLYETLRHTVERHRQVEKLRTWEHLLLGGLSGAVAASATMPLDVAKTALQCGTGRSISQTFQELLREKGMPGLFAGMGPRVAQIALQGAVFFTLFEAWKAQLKPPPLRLEDDRLMAPKLWRKRRDHVWKRQFVIQ